MNEELRHELVRLTYSPEIVNFELSREQGLEILEEIERLNNIIKEIREYITYWHYRNDFRTNSFTTGVKEELLKILDKVGVDKE